MLALIPDGRTPMRRNQEMFKIAIWKRKQEGERVGKKMSYKRSNRVDELLGGRRFKSPLPRFPDTRC